MSRLKSFPVDLGMVGHDGASADSAVESPWRLTARYVSSDVEHQNDLSLPHIVGKSAMFADDSIPGSRDGYVAAWLLIGVSLGLLLAGFLILAGLHFV